MSATTSSTRDLLPPQLQSLIPYYVLILVVLIFYSGVYDNAFLYDDRYLIVQNSYLQSWHSIGTIFHSYLNSGALRPGHFYRPLQNLLYLMVYQTAGPSLFGFHFLNIVLHGANACLVFALGSRLNFNRWGSFLAALLWALHPLQTEAVTYMSGTADMLHSFFCLLGIVIALPNFTPRRMLWAAAFYLLALLSKEAAIIFPLLMMGSLYLTSEKRLDPRTYIKTWPLWCVTIGYAALRFTWMPLGHQDLLNTDPTSQLYATHITLRLYTFLATIPSYLQLLIWPTGLHMDRDFRVRLDPWFPEVGIGLVLILAALTCIVLSRKKARPAFSWGLLWFAGAHIPQAGLLFPVNALFLEHWMYLPTIGLFLGSAEALTPYLIRLKLTQLAIVTAFCLSLILGILTYQQNTIWHDPIVFYKNILDRGETSARARNNLGISYEEKGDYVKAMEQFQLALQNNDLTPETHQNIASLLSKMPAADSHIQEEIDELNKALKIDPDFLPAHEALASIYTYKGDKAKAAYYQQKADILRKGFGSQ